MATNAFTVVVSLCRRTRLSGHGSCGMSIGWLKQAECSRALSSKRLAAPAKLPHLGAMPAGRPRKEPELPPEKIEQLASIGATDEEIGLLCGLDDTTIQKNYSALLKTGRAKL